MKYIQSYKLFEAKKIDKSDLYEEIVKTKYDSLLKKHVKMSKYEVEQIKDELESFGMTPEESGELVTKHRHLIRGKTEHLKYYLVRVIIVISKIEDEYFLVSFPAQLNRDEDLFFKCDSIDGLVELIDIYFK